MTYSSNAQPIVREDGQIAGYTVFGKKATKNEYNVARALDYFEIPYLFQVTYWGGHSLIGGQALDFMITAPLQVPVQVYGEYWHKGQMSSRDRYNQIRLEQMVRRPITILWGFETETEEDTRRTVRKKLM